MILILLQLTFVKLIILKILLIYAIIKLLPVLGSLSRMRGYGEMSLTAKKGDWVQIHSIVLKPEERTGKIPGDTKKVPLEMWVKGFINSDAEVGDKVSVTTLTGRKVEGELVEVNPKYIHNFGEEYVPELLEIDIQVRNIVKAGEL